MTLYTDLRRLDVDSSCHDQSVNDNLERRILAVERIWEVVCGQMMSEAPTLTIIYLIVIVYSNRITSAGPMPAASGFRRKLGPYRQDTIFI